MELFLIIVATLIVVIFTILSFYTSVNSGASKFEKWIDKKEKEKSN
jgi:cell division protein FtsL